jgi:hypothetical protein
MTLASNPGDVPAEVANLFWPSWQPVYPYFTITEPNSGVLQNFGLGLYDDFAGFGNLKGASGFQFAGNGSLAGSINGTIDGGTSGTLDFSGWGGTPSITLTGPGTAVGFHGTAAGIVQGGFDNISGLNGKAGATFSVLGTPGSDQFTVGSVGDTPNVLQLNGRSASVGGFDSIGLAGQGGSDRYTVNFSTNLTIPVTITGSALDVVTVNGSADPDTANYITKNTGSQTTITWGPSAGPPVETVTYTGIQTTNIVGGQGTNVITDPGSHTIPIKFQLTDANGHFISSLGAITSLRVLNAQGANVLTNAGSTALRYDATANQFIANWQTKGLSAGTYTVTLVLADGTTHTKVVQLSANGGGNLLADTGGSSGSASAGALLAGDLTLAVDSSAGNFTADELARVDDAVAAINTVVGAYGVTIVEVSAADSAATVLQIAPTTALGGAAEGVLGCEDGNITLVSGWNWYTGASPSVVGAGQYDFETIVMHELGHALGLGHSADTGSVMFATLAPGEARRSLSVADLNVPDADAGPCGLHAALVPAPAPVVPAPEPGPLAPEQPAPLLNGPAALGVWETVAPSALPAVGQPPQGSSTDLVLVGGNGADLLIAGAGRDLLVAGFGADRLADHPEQAPVATTAHDLAALDALLSGAVAGRIGPSRSALFWGNTAESGQDRSSGPSTNTFATDFDLILS